MNIRIRRWLRNAWLDLLDAAHPAPPVSRVTSGERSTKAKVEAGIGPITEALDTVLNLLGPPPVQPVRRRQRGGDPR